MGTLSRQHLFRDARPDSLEVLKSLAAVGSVVVLVLGHTHQTES
jgi:predicted phosphodiesterase